MTIKGQLRYWSDRGYGFIKPTTGEPDIFVHATELQRAGVAVPPELDSFYEFTIARDRDNRPRAANVRLLSGREAEEELAWARTA